MDYLCAKFGDFSFSHFDFIVWTDRQTDRQTESQTRMIAILMSDSDFVGKMKKVDNS